MEFRRGRSDEPSHPGDNVCATSGDVLIDRLLKTDGVGVWSAMFKPGSYTYWHSHDNGQVFLISAGKGIIATKDGDHHVVQAGDVVHTPPGEVHFHGAAPDAFVTYTSISLGETRFGDPVSDEEYEGHWH